MILKKNANNDKDAVKAVQSLLGISADGIFGPQTEAAVKQWQREHGLEDNGIVGDKTFAAMFPQDLSSADLPLRLKKSSRAINEIIVHCSATEEGKHYSVETIRKWHVARGFKDIGYNYVVYLDGSIHEGRNVNIAGAHTTNHNARSIGICYIGGLDKKHKPKDTRTDAQKAALLKLIRALKKLYPNATVHGHREFANKACPCFDAYKEYRHV